ncbi:potassium channel family protein [Brachybacterium hainanense]|uniref:Potassium channel family protein n=1 Tax=Brachybacterium hainanense TaxID=1541174 RepID=A0ABV6RDV7_9MICO
MHFVIMGCGRVGAMLAHRTIADGHTAAVIDQDPRSFQRLDEDLPAARITGPGFDRAVLEQAGIREAAGFAAVSSGDNSNIIAARVVREEYGLRRVVARIYDPRRAEVYERLGIATVATVRWTAAQVLHRLVPSSPSHEYQDVSGMLTMLSVAPHPSWMGQALQAVERRTGSRAVYVTRLGEGLLPREDLRLQDGDRLHLMAPTAQLADVESLLAHPLVEEEQI